jgi:DNA primase|tara:strand:- start:3508 stop:4449 length:942 start_codon:yes stop_codon:yes gene_type:complete
VSTRKKLETLQDILGPYRTSNDEYLFNCPVCNHHKKKLSINLEKDKFKCWVCDYSGRSIIRLVRKCGTFDQKKHWRHLCNIIDHSSVVESLFDKNDEKQKIKINLPKEFKTLTNKHIPRCALPAISYLKRRGVDTADILYWKMGYCAMGEYRDRIVIPSFNNDGDVNYFVARSYDCNNRLKYKNPNVSRNIVFNELFVDFDEDLILVEGVFDAVTVGQNAIPLLGSTLNEKSELFRKILEHDSKVYVALDRDAEKKSFRLIEKFLLYGVEVYKIDTRGYEDVGSMSKFEFERRKNMTTAVTNDKLAIFSALAS